MSQQNLFGVCRGCGRPEFLWGWKGMWPTKISLGDVGHQNFFRGCGSPKFFWSLKGMWVTKIS